MATFMLLLHDNPKKWAEASPEEMQKAIMKYRGWGEKLKSLGVYQGSNKLMDDGGKVMRGKNPRVTDGPYSEAKEVLGGYFAVEAATYDAAIDLARDCPHLEYGGTIEVRMVDDPANRK